MECNVETSACQYFVQFTELPDLVTDEILKHLEISDKLYLRLTCHFTKKLVETPSFMSIFKLVINSQEEMDNLIKSSKIFPSTKWKSIRFAEKTFTSYATFPTFVSTFSNHLTILHLKHFSGSLAEILFLSSCELLEHLNIDEMDLRQNPTLVVASDKMLKAKCPKLLDIFTNLKTFQIGVIFFNDVKTLSFYQTFLQRCRKLEKLNVPRPQGPTTISWEALKNIQLKSIIGPISEYLRKKPITNPLKTDIKLMNVDGLFSRHFPVVAEACVQIGSPTLFENVNEKHVKYLFTHEGDILQRIVSLKEKVDDRRPVEKWTALEKLFVRSSRCDVRNEYQQFTAYPNLKVLTIVMDSRSKEDPNYMMLQRLVKLLILAEREKLREFYLQWSLFSHDSPQDYIRAHDFVGNFSNLTKLHVSGWSVPDSDFVLVFNILGKLKTLILEECCNLTDEGFLGSQSNSTPPILNLTNLEILEIRNRFNKGLLTDVCIEKAFMHMRLRVFMIESYHVTRNGYDLLSTGEFSKTISKLPCPHTLPRGILTNDEFTQLILSNFPNIVL